MNNPCPNSYANGKHFDKRDTETIGMLNNGVCTGCGRRFDDECLAGGRGVKKSFFEETIGDYSGHCPKDGC